MVPVATRTRRLSLSWRVSILVAVLLIISAVVTTAFAVRSIQSQLFLQSEEGAGNVHASVAAGIQSEYAAIARYRDQTLERRKSLLKEVAAPLVIALDALRAAAESGELTMDEAQSRAKDMLRSVRFGNDDYFFTYNRDLTAIAHPDERFEGRNLTDLQDADGVYVLQEIRDVALNEGSGYVNYRWERLDGAEPSPKIGYVFHYEPWDWIIGTGVYVDDIDSDVAEQVLGVQSDLERIFAEITFAEDGFFFILDQDGEVVATANPAVESAGATGTGQAALEEIQRAAPSEPGTETTLRVSAPWADEVVEDWSVRVSTTGGDPDWILVSAVPEQRLEAPGRSLAGQLILLSVAVLLLGLAFGILLSRRITRPVDDITAAAVGLADGTFDPSRLDAASTRSDEVGELARAFQRMGTEVVEREARLREQVQQLTVQIDRSRVDSEVEQITESEYFQRLKAQADELRHRDG